MNLKQSFITLFVFMGIDSLGLGRVAPEFYRAQIEHLMAATPNLTAAGVFYMLFVGVFVYFVVEPGVGAGTIRDALVRGAVPASSEAGIPQIDFSTVSLVIRLRVDSLL